MNNKAATTIVLSMKFKKSLQSRSPVHRRAQSSEGNRFPYTADILVSNIAEGIESRDFSPVDTTCMDSTSFCRVCFNDNHDASCRTMNSRML